MEFYIVKTWSELRQKYVEVARFTDKNVAEQHAKKYHDAKIQTAWKPGFAPF